MGRRWTATLSNPKRKLHVCGNNPTCDGYEIEEGEFRIKGYDGPVVECEKCGSEMHLKMGRFGKYMACTNDECKNTRKILRNGEVAPPKEDPVPLPELPCEKSDAYFVLRDGAAGVFLAANTFPKSRETRAPLVEELYRFRDRLPEKLRYLADAPQQDPEGNKTLVRFSRKTKQQYVASEKRAKRPAGQLSLSTVSGRKPKSNGVRSGRKARFSCSGDRQRECISLPCRLPLFALISSPYNHLYYFSLASIQC